MKLHVAIFCGIERDSWVNPSLCQLACKFTNENFVRQHLPSWIVKTVLSNKHHRIDVNRNLEMEDAIKDGATWVLFIDNDQVPPDNILQLVAEANARPDVNIVSPPTWMHGLLINSGGMDKIYPAYRMRLPTYPKGFQEVKWAGAGVMLIRCEMVRKLPKPWFRWEHDIVGDDMKQAEDEYFCHLAQRHHYKVHTHTDYPCGHLKTEDLQEMSKALFGVYDRLTAQQGAPVKVA